MKVREIESFWWVTLSVLKKESGLQGKFEHRLNDQVKSPSCMHHELHQAARKDSPGPGAVAHGRKSSATSVNLCRTSRGADNRRSFSRCGSRRSQSGQPPDTTPSPSHSRLPLSTPRLCDSKREVLGRRVSVDDYWANLEAHAWHPGWSRSAWPSLFSFHARPTRHQLGDLSPGSRSGPANHRPASYCWRPKRITLARAGYLWAMPWSHQWRSGS